MSLSLAGAIAMRSLGAISDQIGVTSRNISGAGVAGVSEKIGRVVTDETGVEFVAVGRSANAPLYRHLLSARAQTRRWRWARARAGASRSPRRKTRSRRP